MEQDDHNDYVCSSFTGDSIVGSSNDEKIYPEPEEVVQDEGGT